MTLPQRKEKREDGGFHRSHGTPVFFEPRMTLTGLDVLAHEGFSRLRGGRIGLVTHSAAVDRRFRQATELLAATEDVDLVAVFGPEHGLHGQAQDLESVTHAETAAPARRTYSLYGDTAASLRPTATQLAGIDTLVWALDQHWRVRTSAQHAFRRPTLNELYRPFRQGANVTEANPALRTERVTSAETGVEWTSGIPRTRPAPLPPTARDQPKPVAALSLAATVFWNELSDAVGNVTIARGPGTFPVVGPIASGGLGRQRLNLDRTRVCGVELSAKWSPLATLTITGDALINDAAVRKAELAPGLVGNRVAQVTRGSASLGAVWRAPGKFTLTPRVRATGRQFEDDENRLTLGSVLVADLGVSRPLTKHLEAFVTAENLGNARIETGRSVDGVVNLGTPRFVVGGLRGSW